MTEKTELTKKYKLEVKNEILNYINEEYNTKDILNKLEVLDDFKLPRNYTMQKLNKISVYKKNDVNYTTLYQNKYNFNQNYLHLISHGRLNIKYIKLDKCEAKYISFNIQKISQTCKTDYEKYINFINDLITKKNIDDNPNFKMSTKSDSFKLYKDFIFGLNEKYDFIHEIHIGSKTYPQLRIIDLTIKIIFKTIDKIITYDIDINNKTNKETSNNEKSLNEKSINEIIINKLNLLIDKISNASSKQYAALYPFKTTITEERSYDHNIKNQDILKKIEDPIKKEEFKSRIRKSIKGLTVKTYFKGFMFYNIEGCEKKEDNIVTYDDDENDYEEDNNIYLSNYNNSLEKITIEDIDSMINDSELSSSISYNKKIKSLIYEKKNINLYEDVTKKINDLPKSVIDDTDIESDKDDKDDKDHENDENDENDENEKKIKKTNSDIENFLDSDKESEENSNEES